MLSTHNRAGQHSIAKLKTAKISNDQFLNITVLTVKDFLLNFSVNLGSSKKVILPQ